MLYLTFPLAALIELLAPVALAVGLTWRFGRRYWLLVGVGALTFIGSQVVHLPLNWLLGKLGLIVNDRAAAIRTAIVLGLSAGVCEETARAVGYWALRQRARAWQAALALGAGHGGIESILVGALVLLTFVNMLVVRNLDLATLGLTGEQLEMAQKQVAEYWGLAWHMPLTGAVERLIAILLHLSLSVLVLQAFVRRNALFYLAAIMWHTLANAIAVILLMNEWSAWAIEGALALTAPISLGIILAFRHGPPDAEPPPSPLPPPPIELEPKDKPDPLREQIERSKFNT